VAGNLSIAGTLCGVRLFFAGVPAVEPASTVPVIAVEVLSRLGVRMILGRDLLSRCILIDNEPEGRCTVAF
jgi:hydrogenase maturation factor HypE